MATQTFLSVEKLTAVLANETTFTFAPIHMAGTGFVTISGDQGKKMEN